MASLTDDSRGVIYDHNMFIVHATRNTNWRGRFSTVDLPIKVATFVTKVNNNINVKSY